MMKGRWGMGIFIVIKKKKIIEIMKLDKYTLSKTEKNNLKISQREA